MYSTLEVLSKALPRILSKIVSIFSSVFDNVNAILIFAAMVVCVMLFYLFLGFKGNCREEEYEEQEAVIKENDRVKVIYLRCLKRYRRVKR